MKLAVDAMGGDYAPEEVIKGVEQARDAYPDIEFLVFGQAERVTPLVTNMTRISVKNADEVITMEDEPVRAVRRKKNSSIVLAAQAVKDGEADAFFSAGNTGAVLAAGLFIVGRIKGIDRPGLTTTMPIIGSETANQFVMLDVGANADYKPFNLVQYAIMGKSYAESVMHVANPRIGLLNNGTESDKGDRAHRATYDALAGLTDINFVGNVESRDLLNGPADVVVTDGFTGNATLKAIEGTALTMLSTIKDGIMAGGMKSKLGALMLKDTFRSVGHQMDYSQYGGAVLLGLQAPVVKTHGSSKAKTIKNTIAQIKAMVDGGSVKDVNTYFETHSDDMAALKDKLK
ncbi:phosphate acyltransferase PlsX [Levilactobacillus bambusae]|uniref:Phosphate acyltransferase n=1 Tax=Levilactobacillus bambusae TaxID=2024736 RepID=A0A2V1N0Z3_9LACO|nr:phosphate acyltransferase PlsX [Levilactobacillus bambusae]PWG00907.1 phosphate acyltransferase PlsX [Levilactobacillus bambusae]